MELNELRAIVAAQGTFIDPSSIPEDRYDEVLACLDREIEEAKPVSPAKGSGKMLQVLPEEDEGLRFHVGWFSLKDDDADIELDLTAGVGVGNTYLMLGVSMNGRKVRECIDVRSLATDWGNRIVAEMRQAKQEDEQENKEIDA